jgi:DNA mismatch repair protein MutL
MSGIRNENQTLPASTASVPGRVQLLPAEVIHRIAAGEVVDRPASLLKELVENSVDAGATQIQVTIVDGGLASIQVEDNGWGMSLEDLEQCVQRHATSKIQSAEDLEAILQLGFRGEALSAISSVAKLTIDTFREGSGAWTLAVLGGRREPPRPSSRRQGTRLLVEDLFFNVPARRKFLRRPSTEAQECADTLEALALSHPQVALGWVLASKHGEIETQVRLRAGTLAERFAELRGGNAGDATAEVASAQSGDLPPEEGVVRIEVALCKPPVSGRNARSVQLIVNGRPISEKRLPYVAREAFAGLIEVGRFPCMVASVTADPTKIDVNIHPQKKEIRWAQGSNVLSHVYRVTREALGLERASGRTPAQGVARSTELAPSPAILPAVAGPSPAAGSGERASPTFARSAPRVTDDIPLFQTSASNFNSSPNAFTKAAAGDAPEHNAHLHNTNSASESGVSNSARSAAFATYATAPAERPTFPPSVVPLAGLSAGPSPVFRFAELRVVGEVGASWIVCESPQGLVLIDQHAAHERLQFDRCMRKDNLIRSKPLFIPIELALPRALRDARKEVIHALEQAGFEVGDPLEGADPSVLEVIAVPEADRGIDWDDLAKEIFGEISEEGAVPERIVERVRVRVAASLACHGSVRRGQRLSNEEIQSLFTDLDQIDWGGLCPHGRPLWYVLPHDRIAGLFHR